MGEKDKRQAALSEARVSVVISVFIVKSGLEMLREGTEEVLGYALKNRSEVFRTIEAEVREAFPDYTFQLTMDIDLVSMTQKNDTGQYRIRK